MTYGTGIWFWWFLNVMWFLPSVGIFIFVEFLLIPKQSPLCWIRRSSFVKPYRQRSQKYVLHLCLF